MTDQPLTFMDHMVELRGRLIKALAALALGTVVAAFFYNDLLEILSRPYIQGTGGNELAVFQPTEAFTLVLKLALFGGVVLAAPVIIYQIWAFVSPALTAREKKWVIPLSGALGLLFATGVVAGYLALPLTLRVLLGFGDQFLEPTIGAEFYLRFAMRFLLGFGVALEFPVFLFAAAAFGITSSRKLGSWRRYALGIILVAAALLTPGGDPVTLILLAAPMYLLYEMTILTIRFVLKK